MKSPQHTLRALIMILDSLSFPAPLREIAQPPALLFYQGDTAVLQQPAIAVVGSRAMTSYGEQACRVLVTGLVRAGLVIVSGLALGIDGVAHRQALACGGKTIAVVGSGLAPKAIFPHSHLTLAKKIVAQGGLLLSEYPDDTLARAYYFPERNRIIAGLTLGTVVVEAAERSGALLTARFALDCNREVFAVPGSIFSSRSVGTNRLIQRGAKLVNNAQDILAELNIETNESPAESSSLAGSAAATNKLPLHHLLPEQKKIIRCLADEPGSAEQLVQNTGLSALSIMINLTELEIKGIVRKNREQNYEISHC